jgi:hypothetical protein
MRTVENQSLPRGAVRAALVPLLLAAVIGAIWFLAPAASANAPASVADGQADVVLSCVTIDKTNSNKPRADYGSDCNNAASDLDRLHITVDSHPYGDAKVRYYWAVRIDADGHGQFGYCAAHEYGFRTECGKLKNVSSFSPKKPIHGLSSRLTLFKGGETVRWRAPKSGTATSELEVCVHVLQSRNVWRFGCYSIN